MKYAQGIIGLLVGTALGGSVIAATGETVGTDKNAIRATVLEVIKEEPQAIIDSLNNWQATQQKQKTADASAALKDAATNAAVHDTTDSPFIGKADSTKTVVEFFDYNCPACKMQFQELDKLHKADADVKIIFKEYPIFGAQSETNSKIGIAVHRLYPEKYFAWHSKMMGTQGRTDEASALKYATQVGMDADKVKTESQSDAVAKILETERALGQKLNLQGTPSLIVADELVPHALRVEEIKEKWAK